MTRTADQTLTPPLQGQELLKIYRQHLSRGRALFGQVSGTLDEVESDGAWVSTSDGRRLLDAGGFGVFLHGHRHPVVVAAVRRQLDRHPMTTRMLLDPVCADAARTLASVAPGGLDHVHWVTSGAEATETAIKLARAGGYRRLIAAAGGFHGKTLGALSVSSRATFRDPFRPLLPATHVPYGDAAALEAALQASSEPACVIIEPVLGEAGVILPPPGYLRAVQAQCRAAGALFVLDEIQTGLGRTGRWWGADHDGVTPDLLLVGKVLSGGVVPVAAVLASDAAYEPFDRDPFLHSSTFGGAPLACAAARAAVEVIRDEDLVGRAATIGARLLEGVRSITHERFGELVLEVRGRGLMVGIEFTTAGLVGEMVLDLLHEGLIVSTSLNEDRVLRLTPPAILNAFEEEALLTRFDRAAKAVASRCRTPTAGRAPGPVNP